MNCGYKKELRNSKLFFLISKCMLSGLVTWFLEPSHSPWSLTRVPPVCAYSLSSLNFYLWNFFVIWNKIVSSTCCATLPSVLCRVLTEKPDVLLYTVFPANSHFSNLSFKKKLNSASYFSFGNYVSGRQHGVVKLK